MTYNLKRHIKLLKHSQYLKNQSKYFQSRELSHYNIAVDQHLFWEQRYKVYELIQDFLNRKIDGEEFACRVFGFRRNLMIASDQFRV
jgi:hypothetical protein